MAPKKNYTPLQMAQAIEAVRKGEKIAAAARKFCVPRITLHDKISGKTPIECSMGPNTYLSMEEEAILEKWILEMAKKHIPITRDELLDSVQRIIIDQKKITPFTDNRPGRKWYNLFLNRHPVLSERTAQNLTTARDAVTEEGIKRWFGEVASYLREKNVMGVVEDPARIFNTDESAFFLSPKVGKVLAKKGDKHIYQSSGDEKDNLTVLITGNAAGQLAPPMVVFAYERVPAIISSQFPEGWAIGRSPSGWMCGSTFYEYIANIFNPWLIMKNIQKPVLFFLDGHRSHLTLHLSNFCTENGIEIIALHPNSTHILQPMDLAVFRPLKTYWRKAVKDWKLQNLGQNLKKEHFGPVLKTALQSITENSIKNGFRAGGLCPFGPDYVDLTKLKSRHKPQSSTEQIVFFNYLEKEIVAKLGAKKLQLFNELFYKGRDELNSRLNEEDLSLYVIWANNKQTVEPSRHPNEPSSGQLVEIPNSPSKQFNFPVTNEETENISVETELDRQTHVEHVYSVSLHEITSNDSTSPTILQESKENSYNLIIDKPNCSNLTDLVAIASTSCSSTFAAAKIESSKDTTIPEPQEKSKEASIVNEPSSSNHLINPLEIALAEKTPLKEFIRPVTSKSIPTKVGGALIPSPFKRNLFWPGEDDEKKGRKRKLKEKIPCAITSQSWRDYHTRKEEEKREKEKQKEIKAKEREEKKQLKLKEIENKKQKKLKENESKKLKRNRTAKPNPDDTSSDNTDTELNYAESEDSYNMETEEEITDNEQATEKSDILESEDVPLSQFSKKPIKYSSGDYVIIKYEGEYFPGVIEDVRENMFQISTMTFSLGNTFKWPEKKDTIWYQKSDIVEAISKPVLCNKRGFYTITEMKKYLPFTV